MEKGVDKRKPSFVANLVANQRPMYTPNIDLKIKHVCWPSLFVRVYGSWADGTTHPDIWDTSLQKPTKLELRYCTVAALMDIFFRFL